MTVYGYGGKCLRCRAAKAEKDHLLCAACQATGETCGELTRPHMANRVRLALWNLRSAVDEAMGDSDLVDDDTRLFAAMQEASHVLNETP